MIRAISATAKAPRLVHIPRWKSRAPTPSGRPDTAERAAALSQSEAHYRRVRDAAEASFFMNGGRYL